MFAELVMHTALSVVSILYGVDELAQSITGGSALRLLKSELLLLIGAGEALVVFNAVAVHFG